MDIPKSFESFDQLQEYFQRPHNASIGIGRSNDSATITIMTNEDRSKCTCVYNFVEGSKLELASEENHDYSDVEKSRTAPSSTKNTGKTSKSKKQKEPKAEPTPEPVTEPSASQ